MNTLLQTSIFKTWIIALQDTKARAAILRRIRMAEDGNFGDCKPVGSGVSEMRVDVGAGYRVYFIRNGLVIYVLLCGGDKSSQQRDIKRAIDLATKLKD